MFAGSVLLELEGELALVVNTRFVWMRWRNRLSSWTISYRAAILSAASVRCSGTSPGCASSNRLATAAITVGGLIDRDLRLSGTQGTSCRI
jgi:hypothetical protein